MGSHWLINSSSSALSSQHPQTFIFFPRVMKNIKHDRYCFPHGLERLNPHENYPRTRERRAGVIAAMRGGSLSMFLSCAADFNSALHVSSSLNQVHGHGIVRRSGFFIMIFCSHTHAVKVVSTVKMKTHRKI
jgi:hypothetical protein